MPTSDEQAARVLEMMALALGDGTLGGGARDKTTRRTYAAAVLEVWASSLLLLATLQ